MYKFIDHTADVLFEASGKTMEELFSECALALAETQVGLEGFSENEVKEFKVESKSYESLLFDFLDDLIFYKDSELLILKKFELKFDGFKLYVKGYGEKMDRDRHELHVDVKAVTMHMFEVWQEDGLWKARVLLDI